MTEITAKPVVVDNGSRTIKAGLADADLPSLFIEFPHIALSSRTQYIGKEHHLKQELTSTKYPIDNGIIKDWENMEKIWSHIFQ